MTSRRYDTAELRLDRATRLDNGWLRVPAVVGRADVVLEYARSDGSVFREYRPAEQVFDAESLASGELAPVTNDHPPGNLDATNTRRYQRGSSGPARREDALVVRDLLITDADLVADMLAGKRQVSPGYTVKSIPTPGISPSGERYDAIQTQIRINHHAIVSLGRQGPEVAARMDAGDAIATTLAPRRAPMKTITIEGVAIEVPDEVAAHMQRLDAQATPPTPDPTPPPAPAKLEEPAPQRSDEAEVSALRAERDVLKERLDKLEGGFQARLDARVELLATAKRVCGHDYRSDGKDDLAVMADVIVRLDPEAKAAIEANAKDAGYLRARYDVALRLQEQRTDYSRQILEAARGATRADADPTPLEKSRHDRDQRFATAWQGPRA